MNSHIIFDIVLFVALVVESIFIFMKYKAEKRANQESLDQFKKTILN